MSGTIAVLYGLFVLALDNDKVQRHIATAIEIQLEDLLHSDVSIGNLEFGLFNSVQLRNVVVKDRKGKELLTSRLIFGKIELRPLLEGRISLRNIALLDTKMQLYKETKSGRTNFQYILDALKSEEGGKSSLDLRINSLILRRCALTYDEWYQPRPSVGVFSPHHIDLSDIDANLSLKHLSNDSINLRIRQLAARSSCGWTVEKLRLRLSANRHAGEINDFVLKTAHSHIAQERIIARYDATDPHAFARSIKVAGRLEHAVISTLDIAPIIPKFAHLKQELHLSTLYDIHPRYINARHLSLSNRERSLMLRAHLDLMRSDGKISAISGTIEQLSLQQSLAAHLYRTFTGKEMPQTLQALGNIGLHGKGVFAPSGKSLFCGTIQSALGALTVDASHQRQTVSGRVASKAFDFSSLAAHRFTPSAVDFELNGKADLSNKEGDAKMELRIQKMQLQNNTFRNLHLDASLRQRHLVAQLETHDPAATLTANASADIDRQGNVKHLHAALDVARFSPAALGLTRRWGDGIFSLRANVKLPHLDVERPEGEIDLRDLTLENDAPEVAPYRLNQLSLRIHPNVQGRHLTLRSDCLDAEAEGALDVHGIAGAARNLLTRLTQDFRHPETPHHVVKVQSPMLSLALSLKKTDFLRRVGKIQVEAERPVVIDGTMATDGTNMQLTCTAPHLQWSGMTFRDLSVVAHSEGTDLQLLAKATKTSKNTDLHLEMNGTTRQGRLLTSLQWKELRDNSFSGRIDLASSLQLPHRETNTRFAFSTEILPTTLTVNDSVWNIEPGNITFDNGQLNITNASLSRNDQRVAVSGSYAKESEGLMIDLKKVDVGYAIALTGFDEVTFGGRATGKGVIRPSAEGKVALTAQLDIPDFRLNEAPLGQARINGGFDGKEQTILLDADIREPEISRTLVKGFVSLGRKELDLNVVGENTSIQFLRKYVDGIFAQVEGRSTGRCRIFGGFKTIDFEGYERAWASAKVPITGVTYHVHDAVVVINHGEFRLDSATLTDSIRGKGEVKGALRHSHLRRMKYDFSMSGQRIKLYDRPYETDLPFFSTAYGTGQVRIHGGPGQMTADIRVRTDEGSTLTYLLDRPDETDRQLLTFRDAARKPTSADDSLRAWADEEQKRMLKEKESKTDIRLNMEVEVHPSSVLKMITDIKSGDVITVHGNGPIQASYYNKGGFRMFGTYNIQRGMYDLSIQNVIKKNFMLRPGGTVRFSGDPLDAEVNVEASYLVNSASLADLNIGSGFANNTTPVNCLIHFTGKVSDMNLALDFDLPNIGENEKMMVRNLIASEEDRTMQVLYLLGVGRFFTYDYSNMETATGGSQSEVMMKSLLTSTLSSQINNIIANAVGTSNWTFGANVATGQLGWSDMEVDGSLSGRLFNNRLLVNGKVGYHERQAATTNFVGDFDVHYLLTPSGSVNLKAYSETNDRYFSKSSLTTQGVGIQLKHDFNSFRQLFFKKRKNKIKLQQP